MKTILLLAILLTSFTLGCGSDSGNPTTQTLNKDSNSTLETVEYDGCEYVIWSQGVSPGTRGGITHKGNCKNPVHNK